MARKGKAAGSALRAYLSSEAAGGIALIAATGFALVAANSPLAGAYYALLHAPIGPVDAHFLVNDGLMTIFFFLVGLEIKREFVDGRLSSWPQRRLPLIAAGTGMAVPALLYLAVTRGDGALAPGWAIPAATDIAFAIGVLALLGKRAPIALKLFLTTVAIADDLGAVAIIALAYTAQLNTLALGAAAFIAFTLYMLGKNGVTAYWPFALGSVLLWLAILASGVHPTVAGVIAALAIPVVKSPGAPDAAGSMLHRLEARIAPWSAFGIVPLFGFFNAGVALDGIGVSDLAAPLPLGIALGLFVGKQAGILGSVWLAVRLGVAAPLKDVGAVQLWGIAALCGIGFTMSLFIGALAFPADPARIEEAKLGILLGSLTSALAGYALLRFAPMRKNAPNQGQIRK